MTPLVFTVPEAAKLLGIARHTAYDAIRRGDIPAIRIGKSVKVPKAALERLLAGEAPAKGPVSQTDPRA